MRVRTGELALVALVATMLTMAAALPVMRAPSARVFGAPIVGVHHDPFTMMQVWEGPVILRPTFQPVTDLPGHWLAITVGPVAAYNWIVLLSFPLAAIGAFALARYLALPAGGAALTAIAFAFSPFHLAHAAYHPHIAQVQWIPLYVLALWHAVDRRSAASLLYWCVAAAAVTWSNFYGGFIAAVLTPILVVVRWPGMPRRARGVALALLAAAAVAWIIFTGPADPAQGVASYSANLAAYVLPPVAHPVLGASVIGLWHRAGIGPELLEQQLTLGVGILALAAIAVGAWWRHRRDQAPASLRAVPALMVVAVAAGILSVSPASLVPVFRAHARFGVVVHLMAVLLAGIGFATLRCQPSRWPRRLAVAVVVVILCEYAVAPSRMWREVWPTTAHRWVHDQPTGLRVIDCVPYSPRTASDVWLTRGRVQLLGGPVTDCGEPHLAPKLAALGFTHLLVRARADDAAAYGVTTHPPGLTPVVRDADASLWAVTAPIPAIYVDTMTGLSPREQDTERSWRWMGAAARWSVVNPGPVPVLATLHLELSAFHHARVIVVRLDDQAGHDLAVLPERQVYTIGPFLVAPGHHALNFLAAAPPTRPADIGAGNDHRPLSIAFGGWRWTTVPQVE